MAERVELSYFVGVRDAEDFVVKALEIGCQAGGVTGPAGGEIRSRRGEIRLSSGLHGRDVGEYLAGVVGASGRTRQREFYRRGQRWPR